MKEMVKKIYDEMLSFEIWNPMTNDNWDVSGEEDGILIQKNGKVFLKDGDVEEATKILAPLYQDFISRTENYLEVVKDGGRSWEFPDHWPVETKVVFGNESDPEDESWGVICGGDLVFSSDDIKKVAKYLREEHLDLGE